MSFATRMDVGRALETQIIDRLRQSGWRAEKFGQEMLSNECRSVIRRYRDAEGQTTLLRWLPDILTYTTTAKPFIALIDAKGNISKSSNHSIERASVDADMIIGRMLRIPTFYVFSDFGVFTADDVLNHGRPGPPPREGSGGSGTPYYLVSKSWGSPFDSVFRPSP